MAKQNVEESVGAVEAEVVPPMTKAEARSQIFSSEYTKPKAERVDFNGVTIELRQPRVSKFMEGQSGENREFMVRFLIDNAYLPNTDERMFDVADKEQLLAMPMNSSWTRVISAVQNLIDIKVDDKEKN